MKKVIVITVLAMLVLFILFDSRTISFVTTIENRRGLEYDVSHFELHPERLPGYFRGLWEKISGMFQGGEV